MAEGLRPKVMELLASSGVRIEALSVARDEQWLDAIVTTIKVSDPDADLSVRRGDQFMLSIVIRGDASVFQELDVERFLDCVAAAADAEIIVRRLESACRMPRSPASRGGRRLALYDDGSPLLRATTACQARLQLLTRGTRTG